MIETMRKRTGEKRTCLIRCFVSGEGQVLFLAIHLWIERVSALSAAGVYREALAHGAFWFSLD